MRTKGLLLLDVDGPLNPYAARRSDRRGYRRYRATQDGGWTRGITLRPTGRPVWLHPGHGPLLRAFAQDTGLELVWATAWQHAANERVAPAIGLDTLPVIEFPEADVVVQENGWRSWRPGGGWKWPGVTAFAAGRPLAWLDDEHDGADYALARAAFQRDREDSPTLLCHVDPRHGLRDQHLEKIRNWAADLP